MNNKTQCKVLIQTADDTPVPVIWGGMFFQNYYGYFTNDYSNDTVQVALYVSYAPVVPNIYVGPRILAPSPVNPFEPATVETRSLLWVIIVGSLLLVIAIALGILCIYKVMQKNKEDKESVRMNNAEQEKLIEEAKSNQSFGVAGQPATKDNESGYSIN